MQIELSRLDILDLIGLIYIWILHIYEKSMKRYLIVFNLFSVLHKEIITNILVYTVNEIGW